nr:hypothetical protein CFP56_00945 [Quercus suber]
MSDGHPALSVVGTCGGLSGLMIRLQVLFAPIPPQPLRSSAYASTDPATPVPDQYQYVSDSEGYCVRDLNANQFFAARCSSRSATAPLALVQSLKPPFSSSQTMQSTHASSETPRHLRRSDDEARITVSTITLFERARHITASQESDTMSSAALSSARSTATSKTSHISRRNSAAESLPSLYASSSGESSSDSDSNNPMGHSDEILVTGNTIATAAPFGVARGMTTLSLTLHDVVQTPLSPISMWLENSENSRIERLCCGLSDKPAARPAIERWLAEESEAESDTVSNPGEAVPATS